LSFPFEYFEKLQNPLKHFVTGEREKNEKLETLKPVSSNPFHLEVIVETEMMRPWQKSFIRQSTQQSKGGKEAQRERKTQPSLSTLGACVKTQSGS
jgi:hypothetical protein